MTPTRSAGPRYSPCGFSEEVLGEEGAVTEGEMMNQEEPLDLMHLLRDFMSASAKLKAYLEQDHPLDKLQYGDVAHTILGLHATLGVWEQKNLPNSPDDEGG